MAKGDIPALAADAFSSADLANIWLAITGGVPPVPSSVGQTTLFKVIGVDNGAQQLEFDLAPFLATYPIGTNIKITFNSLRFATRTPVTVPNPAQQELFIQLPDSTNIRALATINSGGSTQVNFLSINNENKSQNSSIEVSTGFIFNNITQVMPPILKATGGLTNLVVVTLPDALQGQIISAIDPIPTNRELDIEVLVVN